jgi:hypothetical protein
MGLVRRIPPLVLVIILALVSSLIAGRWPATSLSATPERQSPHPTGTLQGTVRWNGAEVPRPTDVPKATGADKCGRLHKSRDPLVSDRGGGVHNVIVTLVDVPVGIAPPPLPGRLLLDNVGCRFSPRVAVLTVGSLFEMRNSDPTLHLVHLQGSIEANIALPLAGMTANRTLKKAGMFVVKCDVHGWMQAFIRVVDHPFHAVTDRTGSFRITEVPAGEYTLEVWHEMLGRRQKTVRIRVDTTTTVVLEFSEREP